MTGDDGGPSRSALFRTFPDPLVAYEVEADAAVVRAVNPAFENAFDVDGPAIADDDLADHLLVDAIEIEPQPGDGDGAARSATDAGRASGEATVAAVRARLDEGEPITVVTRRGVDGEPRAFRLRAVSLPDGDVENCLVYTEITDLKAQVRDLQTRAERLERLVDVAAHDLRNPLDVAEIRLEAARDTGEDVHFEKVGTALDRIQHIIQDVLSMGGAEVDSSEEVGLETVARAAWSTVDTAAGTLVLEDDLPTIEADADLLQRIFENLFRNAVEHAGPDVTVTVGDLPDGSASDASGGAGRAERSSGGFYVADDGPGVPATDRERAFDPDYSTVADNTGLGLAIVRQIAEDHGWRVTLTSGDAGGARFEFVGIERDGAS